MAHNMRMFVFNVATVAFRVCFDIIRAICFFSALARQQALYMMCFAQTAQHLYLLVQTKNRYVLQHRGLNKQNT